MLPELWRAAENRLWELFNKNTALRKVDKTTYSE